MPEMNKDIEAGIKLGKKVLKAMQSEMTLTEAIEILEKNVSESLQTATPDYLDAAKLLIEAGTFIRLFRQAEGELTIPLLKGEAEE